MEEYLVKERFERLDRWDKDETAPPFKVLLYPTNICNLKCVFCNGTFRRETGKYNYKPELTLNEWERIVFEGLDIGVRQWWIQGGGEPMCVGEKSMKISEIVKSSEMKTEGMMVTNGTLFRERDIEKLVQLRFDRVVFSIDAPDEKTNDYLRGVKGAFEKGIKNIELFKEYKQRVGSKKPEIYINSVLTSKIWNEIDSFLLLCAEKGVDKLVLNPLRVQGEVREAIENRTIENLALTQEQKNHISSKIPELVEKSKSLGIELEINGVEEVYEPYEKEYTEIVKGGEYSKKTKRGKGFISSLCFEPFLTILIGPLGEVGCCCGDEYEKSPLNIRKKSLKEVWHSEYLSKIRKNMIENMPMRGCFSCGFKTMTETLRSEFIGFSNRTQF